MTLKFPVAMWQDAEGSYTARVIDGAVAAAIDATAANALQQLKRYLAWSIRNEHSVGTSDLSDLELRDAKIRIRPEYRTHDSVFLVATTTLLRVTCIHGQRKDGTRHCVIPTLDLRFSYQPGDPALQLVTEMVQQALGKKTPQELSRELMPARIWLDAVHVRESDAPRHITGARFPALEAVAEILAQRKRGSRFSRAIQRDADVRAVTERLRSGKFNLLLVGESGVGKTTVLVEAIRQYLRERREAAKKGSGVNSGENSASVIRTPELTEGPLGQQSQRQFWLTSGQRLIAGMKYLGQWEERCEQAIEELGESGSVLCAQELLELVRVGDCEPGASVAAFLLPYLQRGELRLIAESAPTELDACRRLLPGLADLFQVIQIREFSAADARIVLDKLLEEGRRNLKLELEPGLADLIYRLYKRFQPYAAFPGRSANFVRQLLDEACRDALRTRNATEGVPYSASARVTHDRVFQRFQRETGLPERLLRDDLPLPHGEVLVEFRAAVLGQEAACQAAAGVVTALKTGLNDPGRPLGVLLFCGPTGVGKTEMAKALARFLFGQGGRLEKDRLVRLDMSEYAGYGAAQRLLMSADSGVSDFLKRVRRQPFTVVLFDEIEKAAPEVHDALLGVLDEGRLTDRFGRTTTFKSAVIVMTSNLGAERSAPVGFDPSLQPSFERIAMGTFRPEFFNRIDAVVTFQPLAHETIVALARRELEAIRQRDGLTKANLQLTWTDAVVQHLAAAGYDARYGARPLLRAIERLVVAPLSAWLLAHADTRNQTITVELDPADQIVVR